MEDKEEIKALLREYSSFCLSAFTFASLVSWETVYHYQWTVSDQTLLIKFITPEDKQEHLLQPVGEFGSELQQEIFRYAATLNYKLKIYGVSESFIKRHPEFTSHFERTEYRDMDNYIYSAEDLAKLEGKRYQPKRNLLYQFENKYNWTSEPISQENISGCFEVLQKVYTPDEANPGSSLGQELNVLEFVLTHFTPLEQHGILVRVDLDPVAFSLFENLNPTTCVVHFEKAIREYKGLYQMINRETAKYIFARGYQYINREEDLGIEGLRKAKLSYYPLTLCPAQALTFKDDP